METKGKVKGEAVTPEGLEAELARLPRPQPPDGLEDALLAAIPATGPGGERVSRVRTAPVAASAAVAAAAAGVIVGFIFLLKGHPSGTDAANTRLLNQTSPRHVLGQVPAANYKETRPCDILPPLPDGHS